MNKKKLFWFSLAIGPLILAVGTAIFVLWWAARDWYAIDYSSLEDYGFKWTLISVPIALIGLITSSIVWSANSENPSKIFVIPPVLILLNIPALIIILNLHTNISERVYFKVFNRSGQEFKTVKLISNSFEMTLGELNRQSSIADNYKPTYIGNENKSVPEIEEITIELLSNSETYKLQMPYSMKGWCQRIILSDSLTLESKWTLK
ncbi:hypothetical protein ABWH96_20570 [Marivirga tractuosa]|uniref:hypothetical protein n=1 Tax=Marivirga tractuosa TaxID=1006 RepID=UPI0035D13829